MGSAAEAFERVRPMLGGRLLLACDFDGTLSRHVIDPWSASIIPTAQRALRRLAAKPNVQVAFISGRTVADLAARVRVGGASYRGDHGAQWAEAPRGFRPGALRTTREHAGGEVAAVARRLKVEVPGAIDEPWLVVEDKGSAVTFHFRGAPDAESARARVTRAVDAVDPGRLLIRTGTRRALELRPDGASTKRDALAGLIEDARPEAAIMLGDDRHDARAFDLLRERRATGRLEGLALAVAGHADVTAEVAPHADLVLASPDEAARFLGALARALAGAH